MKYIFSSIATIYLLSMIILFYHWSISYINVRATPEQLERWHKMLEEDPNADVPLSLSECDSFGVESAHKLRNKIIVFFMCESFVVFFVSLLILWSRRVEFYYALIILAIVSGFFALFILTLRYLIKGIPAVPFG